MNRPASRPSWPALKGQDEPSVPPLSLGALVRKSALLNVSIVATALPVLALVGGPWGALAAAAVLVMVSVFLWTATFAAFSFLSLVRIFRGQGRVAARRRSRAATQAAGLADGWLDGPF
jgi:hypothetical protein